MAVCLYCKKQSYTGVGSCHESPNHGLHHWIGKSKPTRRELEQQIAELKGELEKEDKEIHDLIDFWYKQRLETIEAEERIRIFNEIVKRISSHEEWYVKRNLLPYDWNDYLGKDLRDLKEALKKKEVDSNGK